ncbi:biogenesis of lysosome-related organelles complex 1 subunit 4-like [Clavelina lepadiformis]|uniref:Biogenesis of lysosome-related organelles complex 1 subunit 4 n=1 Tax=Clavelina lepadiformis TaxID=159417 RepID=A0ABP0FLP4_CLALP
MDYDEDETKQKLNDEFIRKTSSDFSEFLKLSPQSSVTNMEESIEEVLTRLDELYGMLDMIRSDNANAVEELLPQIRANMTSLKPVFEQIDFLESFVQVVKRDVSAMEKELRNIEENQSTFNSFKKAISGFSFLSWKKKPPVQPSDRVQSDPYIPPPVFHTSDHIKSDERR